MKIIGRTHTGRIRNNNEDWFVTDEAAGIAVLADGMGGLNAGEIASREAAETVLARLKDNAPRKPADRLTHILAEAVASANSHVYLLSERDPALGSIGTTLVVWHRVDGDRCLVAHIGDSRAYRWRNGELTGLTRDHSLVQQLLEQGLLTPEQARTAPNRHIITRGLGLEARVEADISEYDIVRGDLFLLCSDGLSDMLTDKEIAAVLERPIDGAGFDATADALVDAANDKGGRDNVSVVLISV